MRPPPRRAVTAVILAGGAGRRMGGRNKALLRWRGRTLAAILSARLRCEAASVLIVGDRDRSRLRMHADRVMADAPPARSGPLGGLAAGLRSARTPWVLCCPVDGVVPPARLRQRLARRGGAHARSAAGPHYLHALLPRRARHELARFRAAGGRAAGNAVSTLGIATVDFADAGVVWSLNDATDLRRLRRRRQ